MSDREKWRYVHTLNIYQIALLIEGFDPSEFDFNSSDGWSWDVQKETKAPLIALKHAIDDQSLPLHRRISHDEWGNDVDYGLSLVHIDDLKDWMRRIGLDDCFFRPAKQAADIQNPFGNFYAPKLAAAISAWEAVTADPRLLRGKPPKKAIEAWLKENAAQYDLLNKDGSPNATGIEEIAKVANWKPTGGAPATPEPDQPALELVKSLGRVSNNSPGGFGLTEDEEIPF